MEIYYRFSGFLWFRRFKYFDPILWEFKYQNAHAIVKIWIFGSQFPGNRFVFVIILNDFKGSTFWAYQAQTSADSAVRILSGFIVRCLSVKLRNFQSGWFSSVRISNLNLILADRHRTVIPDRIRTALSADVCLLSSRSSPFRRRLPS